MKNVDLQGIARTVAPWTVVPPAGLILAMQSVLDAIDRNIPGVVVECGVYRGGTSIAMILAQKQRFGEIRKPVYSMDSFQGLPPVKDKDGLHAADFSAGRWGQQWKNFSASLEEVKANFANAGLEPDEAHFVEGWFRDTAPDMARKLADVGISVLRLDGDLYESTMECLDNLVPIVPIGGMIIVDDYYTFDGCTRAVHDFLSRSRRPCQICGGAQKNIGSYFVNCAPGPY